MPGVGHRELSELNHLLRAIPALYVAWALPFLLALILLIPPWQHPDEPQHFLRTAQVADGGLVGYRWGNTAGGRNDPAIVAAVAPFNSVPFNPDRKVTTAMYASAGQFRWSATREEMSFPNTAYYAPVLYVPGAVAVIVGRTLNLTIIQTLYLTRAANAITSTLFTLAALAFARRTRCALLVISMLPMTLELYASASKDALTISLVLFAVGAIDRIIDERRKATGWETGMVTLALLFPILARPPYVVLAGLLLLGCPSKSARPLLAGVSIIACTALWWTYAALTSIVNVPPGDASAQIAFSLANPAHTIAILWATITDQSIELGQGLIGILGWLDTRLPHPFVGFAAAILVSAMLTATAGPSRKPWLAMTCVLVGMLAVYAAIYVTFSPPGAPVVRTLQGRLFLPFAAILPLALPRSTRVGLKLLPLAMAGVFILALIEPAIVIRTLVIRYYLVPG
jgi:uncharacterized membrane protein